MKPLPSAGWGATLISQPDIAQWNLVRLAETLLPLLAEDNDAAVKAAQEAIGEFAKTLETAYAAGLSRKLGRSNRGGTICPWHKTCSIAWPATAPISPWSSATLRRALTTIRVCVRCFQIQLHSTDGRPDGAIGLHKRGANQPSGGRRCARLTQTSSCAIIWWRRRSWQP
jgi:hypothetical protein